MVVILCYLMLLRTQMTLVSTINDAMYAYKDGKFDAAEKIFQTAEDQFLGDENFQSNYFDFLTKVGKYKNILEFEKTCKPSNMHYIENARFYLEVLKSGDFKRISGLVEVSPNYLDVVLIAIEYSLYTGNFSNFQKYMTKGNQLNPESPVLQELKGRYQFVIGNYNAGCVYFKKAGLVQAAEEYEGIVKAYRSIEESGLPGAMRFSKYEAVYKTVLGKTIKDVYHPTIYKHLYHRLLADLATMGCRFSIEGAYKYAERLTTLELTEDTAFLHVKASIIDSKPLQATRDLLNKYRRLLTGQKLKSLKALLVLAEKRHREKKAAEEQERYRQQQRQQRERQQSHMSSPKAGTDFLNYYNVLKATSKMNPKDIKSVYKKAIRIASRSKSPKEKDEKMKKVNKAYKILSDAQTKRMYDQGVDPESPYASQQHHQQQKQYYYSRGSQDDGDPDLNELFNAFFGGRGNQRFNRRERAQYFYFG